MKKKQGKSCDFPCFLACFHASVSAIGQGAFQNTGLKSVTFECDDAVPSPKTLDEFDLSRLEHVSESTVRQLASCDFIKQRQNIVMIGNPGSGKTHLSIALGMNACEAGYRVKFYTAVNLAAELAEAVQMNRLSRFEKALNKNELQIIDELSYLTFSRYQSEMLFQVISERSERSSVIITTNLEFSEWTQLFDNEMMLAALIDRVTFRSFVLNMNCSSSYRFDATAGS